MARNKTLTSLLDDLRIECKLSTNPAHNAQMYDHQVKTLSHTQQWLWEDFNWPHLRVRELVPLQAGQRFYDTPENIDLDRIETIEFRYGGRWLKLEAGIEARHYRQWDSELGVRGYPVLRWQIWEDEQIEVWPISSDDGDAATLDGYLKITGIRKLNTLAAPEDRCDLDSRLIVLFAAAQLIKDEKEAQKKLSLANKLYRRQQGHLTPRRRFKMLGTGATETSLLRGPPPIYYRTTS